VAVLKQMWLQLKLMVADDMVGERVLNRIVNGLCTGDKAVDVKTYLRKYWMK
jgi:hypothetical protein